MPKYKCTFIKFRKGQTSFERTISLAEMKLLLILCDDVKVKYKKNKNQVTFIFHKADNNVFCTVQRVPDYVAKAILSMEEWIE